MLTFGGMAVVAAVVRETRSELPSQDRDAMQEAMDMLVDLFACSFTDKAERAQFKREAGHTGSTD